MQLYNLKIELMYKNEQFFISEVYSSLDNAVKNGIDILDRKMKVENIEDFDYTFEIVEINDLEYAEKFNLVKKSFEEYVKANIAPTHITYQLDYKGNIINTKIEYRINQRENLNSIIMFPHDFEKDAGTHFKIGDIVKVKNNEDNELVKDKLFVVRYLPRKIEGQKYFKNTYALISYYDEKDFKGLFTFEFYEKDIEKYKGKIQDNSYILTLQKIINGDLQISKGLWKDLKNGIIPLEEIKQ